MTIPPLKSALKLSAAPHWPWDEVPVFERARVPFPSVLPRVSKRGILSSSPLAIGLCACGSLSLQHLCLRPCHSARPVRPAASFRSRSSCSQLLTVPHRCGGSNGLGELSARHAPLLLREVLHTHLFTHTCACTHTHGHTHLCNDMCSN